MLVDSAVQVLTIHGPVVSVRVHPLVGQDLDVFPAGSAVQLVGSGQPAAHSVRQPALLGDMVLEIRRRLRGVLVRTIGNTCHGRRNCVLILYPGKTEKC